jgi:hypothetical protein
MIAVGLRGDRTERLDVAVIKLASAVLYLVGAQLGVLV